MTFNVIIPELQVKNGYFIQIQTTNIIQLKNKSGSFCEYFIS